MKDIHNNNYEEPLNHVNTCLQAVRPEDNGHEIC
jgi:hypothetical protein